MRNEPTYFVGSSELAFFVILVASVSFPPPGKGPGPELLGSGLLGHESFVHGETPGRQDPLFALDSFRLLLLWVAPSTSYPCIVQSMAAYEKLLEEEKMKEAALALLNEQEAQAELTKLALQFLDHAEEKDATESSRPAAKK